MAKATGGPGGPLDLPNMPVGVVLPTRTTEPAYAAAPRHSRTSVELEPPLAVASTLESSSRHLDPSDAVAMA